MTTLVPVKVRIKDGTIYTIPANMPVPFEVECEGSGSTEPGFTPSTPESGILPLRLSELVDMEPTDIEIDPESTLVVEANPEEYERLSELGRFATSPYLSNRDVNIEVRSVE